MISIDFVENQYKNTGFDYNLMKANISQQCCCLCGQKQFAISKFKDQAAEKRLDKKATIKFKDWAANIYSTFIAQKFGQLIEHNMRNIFLQKIMQKSRQGDQLQNSFCFLKKLYIRSKQVVSTYVFTLFRMGGEGQKAPSTSFSPATSASVGISPENFLSFSFNPFVTPL